jgi:hypothetical protein
VELASTPKSKLQSPSLSLLGTAVSILQRRDAQDACTRTLVPQRDRLALTVLNVSPTWEYQSPPRLLSIGATLLSVQRLSIGATLLSVQRCMPRPHISSTLSTSLYIYTYEPEVGIPSAKLLNFLYVLIRETSKPMSKTRGSISGLCPGQRSADMPPVLEPATDVSSAVDATDPSLDSCHCYLTSCVTASGAFLRCVRPPGTWSVLSKEGGSLRVRYAEDEGGPDP